MRILDWFRRTPAIGEISTKELKKARMAMERFASELGISPSEVMATFDERNRFVSVGFPPRPIHSPKT